MDAVADKSSLKPFVPLQRLRILVASPGDVAIERDHVSAVAEELNRGIAAQNGFVLEVVRWETHSRYRPTTADYLRSNRNHRHFRGNYVATVWCAKRRFGLRNRGGI